VPAIPSHSTGTVDEAWSASREEGAIPNDAGRATLRRMYAWVDGNGDQDTKSAYKFPHHKVTNGSPGPANVRACTAVIGALNGARGGSSIPSSDRSGVYAHAARHLRAANREPAPLRGAWRVLGTWWKLGGRR
jgi:hypothetical protein